ncbi:MAG TPA: protein kinase, partial [bacterium]|nr:protein kinase [bacterium]
KKLAQGGMAEIFLAKSTGAGGFEKTVIVKRILPRLSAHDKFVRMFINEAKVTSALSHSNIVQIFDFGRVGRDYFIAMEFVDGKDLRSIIRACRDRGRRVPMEFVLYAGVQIGKALHYAHTRTDSDGNPLDLIHRDVSPQNVLVSRHGDVKLTDFGIAKSAETLNQTMANEIKGNFGYMPPEQASGAPLDPRTDVYAAAMVLYELATLKNPFADSNLLVVIQRIREMAPPPPSSFNPAISRAVDHILLRGLEKDPAARWASAGEMASALSEELFPSPTELVQVSFGAFLDSLFPPEGHGRGGETPSRGFLAARTPPPPPAQPAARAEPLAPTSAVPPSPPVPAGKAQVIARREGFPGSPPPTATGPTAKSPAVPPAAEPTTRQPAATPAPARGNGNGHGQANANGNGNGTARPAEEGRFARKIRDQANLARLRLDVAPSNVEVFIDDNPIVVGAPIEIQTSAKVEHRLKLRCEGFSEFSTTFVLSPGEVRDFQIVLAERI